mgnify:CR=1 FL=1
MKPPKGKHIFGTVRVGEKGQIVIPKDARKMFDIQPGDSLVVLGDEGNGIAIMKSDLFMAQVSDAIFRDKGASKSDAPGNAEFYNDVLSAVRRDAEETDE